MTEEPSVRSWESDFKRAENEVQKKVILVQRYGEAQGYLWTVSFYTAAGIFNTAASTVWKGFSALKTDISSSFMK